MKYASSRLQLNTGCLHVKPGPKIILLKLLTILLSGSPCQWWTRQQVTAGLIPQQSQLKKSMSLVRRPFRATSARTVELAGTNQFQMFATVNTKKFPRGILDQVISSEVRDGARERASWSGPQASSFRRQAFKHQAASVKPQAAIFKLQAASVKLSYSRSTVHGYRRSIRGARTKGLC